MFFKVYHREINKENYPAGLANSIHISYSRDGVEYIPLHKNYGILFEEGDISEENTIIPQGVRNPKVFLDKDGFYGLCGQRVFEDGSVSTDSDKVLLWKTRDFIHFDRIGIVDCQMLSEVEPKEELEISDEIALKAIAYWNPIQNTGLVLPEKIEIASREELETYVARATYSDGSVAEKKLRWMDEAVDYSKPGEYEIEAVVGSKPFAFPLSKGYGDPVLLKWDNKWYFIATNDNLGDIGIYVREGEEIEDLFKEGVEEHLILPLDPKRELVQTFWAPEFHYIGGELYILFAVSGQMWGPQCHVMKLQKGKSIILEESWEDPIPVVRMDGSPLAPGAITLDMTYLATPNQSYMIWSYRQHIGSPLDTGSMIYIASVDEKEPWKLTSEPVLLTRPVYGWENVEGTINNEGPYCFIHDHKVYLTYSGGSANSYTYALGLMVADENADLLNLDHWVKENTPVLSFYSVKGEYGPGHNSFFVNDDGELMIAYHGETDVKDHLRCDGIRRVHFRKDGRPDFELSNEQDLKEEYRRIKSKVIVK